MSQSTTIDDFHGIQSAIALLPLGEESRQLGARNLVGKRDVPVKKKFLNLGLLQARA
jgi:hypothetical protein